MQQRYPLENNVSAAAPSWRWPALLCLSLLLIGYFSYHLVTGQRGLLAWSAVNERLETTKDRLSDLTDKQQELEKRVKLLRRDNLDLDMAEEQARRTLGYTEPGERVILLPPVVAP